MIPLTLARLADVVGGSLLEHADQDRLVTAAVIDSRRAQPGSLFVPLPGSRADGHDFIEDAVSRGASGYLLAAGRPAPRVPGALVVDDPGDALLGLGAWLRDTVDPLVVAVTGSVGKTTTKDLIAAACGGGRRVARAPGSYNNDLGVPLTCALLEEDTDVLVAEVGTRGIGDIARLVPLLRPDIAVVTAVAASHLETLGDVDTVARAKQELVEGLAPAATAVLNADDERVAAMAAATRADAISFGLSPSADWSASNVRLDHRARATFMATGPSGTVEVALALAGEHNVRNALAALAVSTLVGVDPEMAVQGLAGARGSRWRMQLVETRNGPVVINDSYNANPASTAAALRTLSHVEVSGRRWALLGEMAELGAHADRAHDEVGRLAAGLGLDGLIAVGPAAAGVARGARDTGLLPPGLVIEAPDAEEALRAARQRVRPGDVILIKASRAVGLERVAAALVEAAGGAVEPAGEEAGP